MPLRMQSYCRERMPKVPVSAGTQCDRNEKTRKLTLPTCDQRPAILAAEKKLKMARSVHAYVRGSTAKFYEWLEKSSGGIVPEGPPVWICGDCHIGNLGPVADAKGRIAIQIRDLDQTVIGNPAHDLIRLGLSLATAARGSDLPGVTTAQMLEHMVEGYEEAMSPDTDADIHAAPDSVLTVMDKAFHRQWRHLAEERLEDVTPVIPLGRRFWPLSAEEKKAIKALCDSEPVRKLATSLHSRKDAASVKLIDAAYWMKGCSSLGRLRYAVLLKVQSGKKAEMCLLDLKEAVSAAAPRSGEASAVTANVPADSAERVVAGARALAPFLGNRMLATRLLGKPVVLRELLPQDLKLEIDQLTRDEAVKAARFLAQVVGRAHARQMTAEMRHEWITELSRHRSKTLDAPSWLWSSIVELLGTHEAAYLHHCRRFALEPADHKAGS
jgi:uncharacterized protein (DUF2252 family)